MGILAYWVHTPHPFILQFNERFGIRYYGVAYLLGFVIAGWLFRVYYRHGKTPLTPPQSMDFMLALTIGVIVGGRLGYFILYKPELFTKDPLALLRVWEGGMSSHGGFLGVCIATAIFAHRQKVRFLHLADLAVSAAPAGLFLGRLANFMNGELWGRVSSVPWAMIFSQSGGGDQPRHPSQLYEAALEGLFLFGYAQFRLWKTEVTTRAPGRLAGEFLVAYAIVRAICEQFREPDADLIYGMSRGTFYSIFLVIGGVVLCIFASREKAATR
ncbi:MAG TPA: prolipoprotein diacylglyceryl transferase [Candidatus Didemnitutus sp.]|nr:prolipoprotein diacylglyceryl transferase [Candidatus Didemnitutus sp.]